MIVWLASYPKSGNTWVRSFLSSYINPKDSDFILEDLAKIGVFPGNNELNFLRKKFGKYKFTDMASHWDFFQKEIIKENKMRLLKTHNTLCSINGHDFANGINSLGLIYIIRDPRDVVVSYSHHLNLSFEETFKRIANKHAVEKTNDLLDKTLLGSWQNHYNSWKYFPIKKIFLRYEDLSSSTHVSFRKIVFFLNDLCGLIVDEKKITKTVESVKFENLKKIEEDSGFIENPNQKLGKKFFRNGKVGQWKKVLSPNLIKRIETEFKNEMIENNYLN